MKRFLPLLTLVMLMSLNHKQLYAQATPDDKHYKTLKEANDLQKSMVVVPADTDTVRHWVYGGNININVSQVAQVQWAGGGNNAVAINSGGTLFTKYQNKHFVWTARLDLAFGTQKQGKMPFRKSDDKILFNTTVGYIFHKGWQFSFLGNYRTQFAPGYNYPNDTTTTLLSRFMAPGYVIGAVGVEYTAPKYFKIFISPITSKTTFVVGNIDSGTAGAIDPTLYGVDKGKHVFEAVGAYVAASFSADVVKNVNYYTKVELFSDYLKNPQNVSVIWNNKIIMKVNNFLDVSFITDLVYDDNIMVPKTDKAGNSYLGKGIQFRENLAVGIGYKFSSKDKKVKEVAK